MSCPNLHTLAVGGPRWPTNFPDFRWSTVINPMNKTRGAVLGSNHLALFSAAKEREAGWAWMAFQERPEIDYMYGVSQCFITAQVANWEKPCYGGGIGQNTCALCSTEMRQLAEPGNQRQPTFPGYVEASFKIAAQLQMAYMLEITPEEALETAEREGNAVLAETRQTLGL